MKKLLSLILAILITLTMFTSCAEPAEALTSVYLNLGEKYLLDLDYEQAIVYFNKVIEVEPRNSRAYMGAAEAYVGLGDTESAIELLKTALEVFSDDEEVTIELLEMLIEIDPTTSEWYITLADIYESRGDTDSAIAVLNDAVSAITNSDSKITILQRLISLDPTNVEWYLELAQEYADNDQRSSAISILRQGMSSVGDEKTKLYDKLIEIDSGTTGWYFELANLYESKDNIISAIDTLELGLNNFEDDATKIDFSEELIEIDETNAEWYLTIAYIYIDQGDVNSAIAILKEGLEKASDTTEIEALLNQLAPDTSGLVETSAYYYDEDGNLNYSIEYEYDSSGNVINRITKTDETIYESVTKYEYDSDNNLINLSDYDYSGELVYMEEYEYYSNGNLESKIQHQDIGHWYQKYEYEYDAQGNVSKETQTDNYSYGGFSDIYTTWINWSYKYDSMNNILECKAVYTYDDETHRIVFYGDDGESHKLDYYITTNEYDENGNLTLVSSTSYSSDGASKTRTTEYTENNSNGYTVKQMLTGTLSVDSPTTVTDIWLEYEFDSNGNIISQTTTDGKVTYKYTYKYEYEYGSDGKVSKCVKTGYYANSGNVYSIEILERIN